MSKIRIGAVTRSVSREAGGLFYAVRRLSESVQATGDVSVSVFGIEDAHTHADASTWSAVSLSAFPVRGPHGVGFAPQLLPALARAPMDILHLHGLWNYASLAVSIERARRRTPLVVTPHGMLDPWGLRQSRMKKWLARRIYEDRNLRSASCLHALCVAELEAIRDAGLRTPVCVIPNGMDLPEANGKRRAPWSSLVSEGSKVLLYLGRIHPKKGLTLLIPAFADAVLRSRITQDDWHLVVAGWDNEGHERELASLSAQHGVTERVHFVGPQMDEAKDAIFERADAFVLPSFSEGLPLVVFEAWGHGLPVLVTQECNVSEVHTHDAGWVVPATMDAVRSGLQLLISASPARRQEMGARGKALVRTRYAWAHIGAQMRAVYEWVLGRASRPETVVVD